MNLIKANNNPAVQGVVAVSDKKQLQKIKDQSAHITDLSKGLRFWDYEEVLKVS